MESVPRSLIEHITAIQLDARMENGWPRGKWKQHSSGFVSTCPFYIPSYLMWALLICSTLNHNALHGVVEAARSVATQRASPLHWAAHTALGVSRFRVNCALTNEGCGPLYRPFDVGQHRSLKSSSFTAGS